MNKKKKKFKKTFKFFLPLFNIILVGILSATAYLTATDTATNSFTLAVDSTGPVVDSFTATSTKSAVTMNITAHDEYRGLTSIKWYYGRCDGSCNVSNYTELPETTMVATTESVTESKTTVECLSYGTYTVYAVLEDAVGNTTTTDPIQITLQKPDAENVSYDNTNSGTTCTTVDCALDELYDIYGD